MEGLEEAEEVSAEVHDEVEGETPEAGVGAVEGVEAEEAQDAAAEAHETAVEGLEEAEEVSAEVHEDAHEASDEAEGEMPEAGVDAEEADDAGDSVADSDTESATTDEEEPAPTSPELGQSGGRLRRWLRRRRNR
ncbi:hypothetical protein H7I53_19985 [Mycolicibacterium pulveris]|uniref:hypothetical protein n=1 Tax=Mycolicibacterium pulveris TaxID=36813 RepID=UPI0021F28212|nr:hypothetical protein [Mycolicibacterium pulveris]MCV6982493.1 hypothetical protein [Mycolicibacterium pulveris]